MEVKVGIQHIGREVSVDTDETADAVERAFQEALANDGMLTLVDNKGGRTLVRASQIGYLDLGKEKPRTVGFGDI